MRFLVTSTILFSLTGWSAAVAGETAIEKTQEMEELRLRVMEQQHLLERQMEQIENQRLQLEQQEDALAQQREAFEALAGELNLMAGHALEEEKMDAVRGAGPSTPAAARNQQNKKDQSAIQKETAQKEDISGGDKEEKAAPSVVASERKPDEPERPPELATPIEEGGVLLPRGALVVTPEIGYLNSSATRVAIEGFSVIPALNIGSFEVTELARDTYSAAINLRYGATSRLEFDLKVPYVYREDSTRNRPVGVGTSVDTVTNVSGDGIGDVALGAHYQINRGKEGWPYFVGNLRFKTTTGKSPFDVTTDPVSGLQTELPTGSGFYAIQPSVTAILPTDPGVIYSNIGYVYNMKDNVGGTAGEIDPGDSISASFGMSVALNEKSSFNLGYSHSTVFKTEQNGQVVAGSRNLQVGALNFGYSHKLSPDTSINLSVGAGLTEDAPDANIVVRLPIRFNLL